ANRTSPLEPATTEAGSLLRLAFAQRLVIVPWGGPAPRIPSGKNKTRTRMRMDATPRTTPGLAPFRCRPAGLDGPLTGTRPPLRPANPWSTKATRIEQGLQRTQPRLLANAASPISKRDFAAWRRSGSQRRFLSAPCPLSRSTFEG